VVLAVGLFAVIQLQLVSIRSASYAREVDQASQLAMGIMDDLQVKALQSVNIQTGAFQGTNIQFLDSTVFGSTIVPISNLTNQDMPISNLQPLLYYEGNSINVSNPINVMGVAQGPAGTSGGGAIYRVNYVAYWPPNQFGTAATNIMWFTVFVSWDSKDYGDPNHIYDSADPALFFKRHMIKMPFYLFQTRL
jgi:hypothetical protein